MHWKHKVTHLISLGSKTDYIEKDNRSGGSKVKEPENLQKNDENVIRLNKKT